MKELRSGEKGFVVVPGVFPPEEIAEARERILALIDSQGEKATHFQVSQADTWRPDDFNLTNNMNVCFKENPLLTGFGRR